MPSICENYSGVVISQDQREPSSVAATQKFFQTFVLPREFVRGTETKEQRYPSISGLQLQVNCEAFEGPKAKIIYILEEEAESNGSWSKLTEGSTEGCHAEGPLVWMDIIFENEVPVTPEMASSKTRFRVSFEAVNGIEKFYYSTPGNYPYGEAQNHEEKALTSPKSSFNFRLLALCADSGTDFLGNPYRSVVIRSSVDKTITTDGENSGYWLSSPQPSKFAVTSYYADLRPYPEVAKYEPVEGKYVPTQASIEEKPVVVDSVLLDPITPGVAFNIYYSSDLTGSETDNPTEREWEEKLWTRVPQSYIASKRETYVLPEPIAAKFIKIEFSYLQSKSYNPGNFQLNTTYKRFPDWVSYTFLAALKKPEFIARKVAVVYDALEFAYQYFLGDTFQKYEIPVVLRTDRNKPVTQNQADPHVLEKINLELNTYSKPPGALANPSTLIGAVATRTAYSQTNYPVEGTPEFASVVQNGVSGLNRENVILDQSMPVMFFYITCRHQYKELQATFEKNRAYFAGISEVAFLRNQYTTTADSEIYIEQGSDGVNSERNDFVVDGEGNWHTY